MRKRETPKGSVPKPTLTGLRDSMVQRAMQGQISGNAIENLYNGAAERMNVAQPARAKKGGK